MTTYHLDLDTGELTQLAPAAAIAAYTDDCYFIDPEALKQPDVKRALGDIYHALRTRRFASSTGPTATDGGEAGEPSTSRT